MVIQFLVNLNALIQRRIRLRQLRPLNQQLRPLIQNPRNAGRIDQLPRHRQSTLKVPIRLGVIPLADTGPAPVREQAGLGFFILEPFCRKRRPSQPLPDIAIAGVDIPRLAQRIGIGQHVGVVALRVDGGHARQQIRPLRFQTLIALRGAVGLGVS